MKTTFISEEQEKLDFVNRATDWFANNPKGTSYTDGAIKKDCYFALRWGLGEDCVLVLKVQDEPILYQNCIPKSSKEDIENT